jgi:HEPN domain-containing protein/ribosomal protein L37E
VGLKTCSRCGEECPDEYQFCAVCGYKLEKERTHAGKTGPGPRKVTKREVKEVCTPAIRKALKDLENAKKSLKAGVYDQAVDAADKAVETALRGWLEQGGITERAQPKEQPVIIRELKKMGYAVPIEKDIQRVRVLRNRIRHRGYSAGRRDAETAIGVVERFIDEAHEIEAKKAEESRRRDLRVPEARRLERREKRMEVRVPSPVPKMKAGLIPNPAVRFWVALAAFWGLFAAGYYVTLYDPYNVFHRLLGWLAKPAAIGIFFIAGILVTLYLGGLGKKIFGSGWRGIAVSAGIFLILLIPPCAMLWLTWYVFPPTDDLSRLGAVTYFMFMAIPSLCFLAGWCASDAGRKPSRGGRAP